MLKGEKQNKLPLPKPKPIAGVEEMAQWVRALILWASGSDLNPHTHVKSMHDHDLNSGGRSKR